MINSAVLSSPWLRVQWGLFLLLLLMAGLVAFGAPLGAGFLIGVAVVLLVVWEFPFVGFYTWIATAPLLGLLVSISTGRFQIGERAFGGSIDVLVGELVAAAVLAVWALRMLFVWRARDMDWRPWLPLAAPFAFLVGAHALSAFSSSVSDPLLVVKYALRPVLFVFLAAVVLPVNFLRTRKRLLMTLGVAAGVGGFFAMDGFRSLFTWQDGISFLYRARPMAILGVLPIGENHNVLAELLLFTAPAAYALGFLVRSVRLRKLAHWAAACMVVIALLTFARSAWIALGVQILLLSATVWRPWLRERKHVLALATIIFLPLAGYMISFSLTPGVRGSTGARTMLSEIALVLFRESPLIGVGAGTFVDRVAQTRAYVMEYGTPLDAHGILQKVIAETGLVGLLALCVVVCAVYMQLRYFLRNMRQGSHEYTAYMILLAAVAGAFTYQLFNTTYWTPKLWLPVGLAIAAGRILSQHIESRDPDFLAPSYG